MGTSALCSVISALAISGCQLDAATDDKSPPEVVVVSEQMSNAQNFNVDLTREDAIYLFEPALDATRLSITCPNLSTISFTDYITERIRSTAESYDPAKHLLRLANAVVPIEPLSSKHDGQSSLEEGDQKPCVYDCWDDGVWEQCINRDC